MSFSFSPSSSTSPSAGKNDDVPVLHTSHVDYLVKLRHVSELSKRALRRHMNAHHSSSSSQHHSTSNASTSLPSSLQRSAEAFGLHSSASSSASARASQVASTGGAKPTDANVVPPASRLALATSHALSERYAVYSSGATYPAAVSEGNFHAYYYFYNQNSQQRGTGPSTASSEASRDYDSLIQSMSFTLFPYSGNHIAHSPVDSRLETLRALLYPKSGKHNHHHPSSVSLGSVLSTRSTTLIARPPTNKHGVLSHAERKHLVEALRIMDELIDAVQKPVMSSGGATIALDVSTAATSTLLAQLFRQRTVLLKFLGLVLEEVDDNRSAAKRLLNLERERMSVNMSTFDEALSGALCCVANAVAALMEDFPFAIASPLPETDTQLRPSHMSYAYSLCFDVASILGREFHCLDVAAGYYELAALIVSLSRQDCVPVARAGAKCRVCGGSVGSAAEPPVKDAGSVSTPSAPMETGSPQEKQSKRERLFGRIGGALNKLRVSTTHGDQTLGGRDAHGKPAGESNEGIRRSDANNPNVAAAQNVPSPLLALTGSFSGEVTSPISSSFSASSFSSPLRGSVLCARCARAYELNGSTQRPLTTEGSELGDEMHSQECVLLPPSDGNQTDSVHVGMTGMFADAMIAAATACAVGGDCGRARVLALDALRQLDKYRRSHMLDVDVRMCTLYNQRSADADASRRRDPNAPLSPQCVLQRSLERPLDPVALRLEKNDDGGRTTNDDAAAVCESREPTATPSTLSFTVVDPTPDSVSTAMHHKRVSQQTETVPRDTHGGATPMEDLNALLATTTDRLHALLLVFFIDAWWEKPAFQNVTSESRAGTTEAATPVGRVRSHGVMAELRAMAEEYRYHERRLGTFLPPHTRHVERLVKPSETDPTTQAQEGQHAESVPSPPSDPAANGDNDATKRRERRRAAFHSFLNSPFASLEFEKLGQDSDDSKSSNSVAQRIPTSYYCSTSRDGAATASLRRVKALSIWCGEAKQRCMPLPAAAGKEYNLPQERSNASGAPMRPAATRFSQLMEQLIVTLEAFTDSHTNELEEKLSFCSNKYSCDSRWDRVMDALNQTLIALGVRSRDLLILAQRAIAVA